MTLLTRRRCRTPGMDQHASESDTDSPSGEQDPVALCATRQGSDRMQALIQEAATKPAKMAEICARMRGHVPALLSKNGNWVLQHLVETLPASCSGFVAEELTLHGRASRAARCSVGNRVIMRLFEWAPGEVWTQLLADQLADDARTLVSDGHARHAMLALLRQGPAEGARRVKDELLAHALEYTEHRSASLVVERRLHGGDEETAVAVWSDARSQYGDGWRSLLGLSAHRGSARVLAALALTTAETVRESIASAASAYPVSWASCEETTTGVETAELVQLSRVRP